MPALLPSRSKVQLNKLKKTGAITKVKQNARRKNKGKGKQATVRSTRPRRPVAAHKETSSTSQSAHTQGTNHDLQAGVVVAGPSRIDSPFPNSKTRGFRTGMRGNTGTLIRNTPAELMEDTSFDEMCIGPGFAGMRA